MKVIFALLPEEVLAYNKFVVRRVPAFRLQVGLRYASVPCLVLLLLASPQYPWAICGLVSLAVAAVWIPFCVWSSRYQFLQKAKKQRGLLEKQTVEISAAGVRQITSHVNSLMQWNSFTEIAETPQQIVFFLDKRHGLIVPKRAFADADGVKKFGEAARKYHTGQEVILSPDSMRVWPPAPRIES